MPENKVREATGRRLGRDREAAEITLPFRIVCTRRESPGDDSRPSFEVRVLPAGRSLLEPRSEG